MGDVYKYCLFVLYSFVDNQSVNKEKTFVNTCMSFKRIKSFYKVYQNGEKERVDTKCPK